jgi:toxin ParE2
VIIRYLAKAQQEFDEALEWYFGQSPQAAFRFADRVEKAHQKMIDSPNLCRRIDDQYRECRLNPFPFSIVFELRRGCVLIVAIAHNSRRPEYWRDDR